MQKNLLLITLCFFVFSCKKEASEIKKSETTPKITVQEAKNFLNDLPTVQTNSQNESGFDAKSLLEKIDWKSAVLVDSGKVLTGKFEGKPTENNFKTGFRKAVFRKDKTGKLILNILEFIPEVYHLWKYKGINNKSFDGKIMIYDEKYQMIHGYKYEGGKIKAEILPVKQSQLKETSTLKNDFSVTTCTQEGFGYTNAEGNPEVGVILKCNTEYFFNYNRFTHIQQVEHDYTNELFGDGYGGTITTPIEIPISDNDFVNINPVDDGKIPIKPQKFKKCFEDGKTASSYKLTIYIDQPVAGSNDHWSLSSGSGNKFTTSNSTTFNVGHAFVGFQKINTDGSSVTQVMGFYPGSSGQNVNGVIKDDSGHEYDVSYTSTVSATKFEIALNNVVSDDILRNYVLSNASGGSQYNCTNAAINWMVNAGVNLPNSTSRGIFSTTPGDFGQDLRQLNNSNKVSGSAPTGKGPCN